MIVGQLFTAAACLAVLAGAALAAPTNLGDDRPLTAAENELTPDVVLQPGAILYAPSETDDPAYRAAIAAITGSPVDYFNATAGTPSAALLDRYACVFTWPNFSYANSVAMGDALANYVDAGGNVVLGAFVTFTTGNSLAGAIMTPAYSPVTSPTGLNHSSLSQYAGDGVTRIYDGVTNFSCTFRDFLALQGAGVQDGSYADGEIASAYRPDFKVIYANGHGGAPVTCSGDSPQLIANACLALPPRSASQAPALSTPGLLLFIVVLVGLGTATLVRRRKTPTSAKTS